MNLIAEAFLNHFTNKVKRPQNEHQPSQNTYEYFYYSCQFVSIRG
jgi:hypothetical protein